MRNIVYSSILLFGLWGLACESPNASVDYPNINTSVSITPQNDLFEVGKNSDDSKLNIKFINESEDNLYYTIPSFFATLQKLTGARWEDKGAWYYITMGATSLETVAPGDTIKTVALDLDHIAKDMPQKIDGSGLYRVHFKIYQDKELNELIPEEDRISQPFEVQL